MNILNELNFMKDFSINESYLEFSIYIDYNLLIHIEECTIYHLKDKTRKRKLLPVISDNYLEKKIEFNKLKHNEISEELNDIEIELQKNMKNEIEKNLYSFKDFLNISLENLEKDKQYDQENILKKNDKQNQIEKNNENILRKYEYINNKISEILKQIMVNIEFEYNYYIEKNDSCNELDISKLSESLNFFKSDFDEVIKILKELVNNIIIKSTAFFDNEIFCEVIENLSFNLNQWSNNKSEKLHEILDLLKENFKKLNDIQ